MLLAVLFLSIFITALVGRLSLSLLVSGVSVLVYLLLKAQGAGGVDFSDLRQLLDLPFIVLSSLHASIVVSEAQFRQDIAESMDENNQTLSKKLGSAAAELKARVRFINGAFDAVPAATVVVDGEGILRSFNTRAEEIFGAKRLPLLDRPIQGQGFLEPLRVAMRAINGEGDASAWLQRHKGDWFYAGLRCGIARDGDGRLSNMVVFIQQIDPPAETPTYQAWKAARQAQIQDYTQGRKSTPSSSEPPAGQAPAAPAAAPAKAPGQQRNALVRDIADTVERDHPDERES